MTHDLDRSLALVDLVTSQTYDQVSAVCHPLFKNTPVQYFAYERYYDIGKALYLGTIPNLINKLIKENLLPSIEELSSFHASSQKASFLSHHMPLPIGAGDSNPDKYNKMIDYGANCHIYNALFIIERRNDYYRFCGFGAKQTNKSVFSFYLNNLSMLEQFIETFETSCQSLIEENVQHNLIELPSYSKNKALTDLTTPSASKLHLSKTITYREMQCLELIGLGYTMKKAAMKLLISPRTVEMHLRNIKEKFGLHSKNQLIEIWHGNYKPDYNIIL